MLVIKADAARGGRETKNHKVSKMLAVSILLTIFSLLAVFQLTG